jgi:hypothetical protein
MDGKPRLASLHLLIIALSHSPYYTERIDTTWCIYIYIFVKTKSCNSIRKCHKTTLKYSAICNYRFASDNISSVIMKYKMFMLFGYLWTFFSYLPQIIFPTGYGNWGAWLSWNPCTVTCGDGTRTRHRSCNGDSCTGLYYETTSCSIAQCPGGCYNSTCIFLFLPYYYLAVVIVLLYWISYDITY